MPDFTTFSHFLTAAFILSITPGPAILYTLARTLRGGKSEGILSALGLFIGGLFHVVAATIGISSLLMNSAIAFTIIKYAGAAYLIYLGFQTLLSRDIIQHFSFRCSQKNPLNPPCKGGLEDQDVSYQGAKCCIN